MHANLMGFIIIISKRQSNRSQWPGMKLSFLDFLFGFPLDHQKHQDMAALADMLAKRLLLQ
jgi:hypothetical protein